jgi:hypothetical protein
MSLRWWHLSVGILASFSATPSPTLHPPYSAGGPLLQDALPEYPFSVLLLQHPWNGWKLRLYIQIPHKHLLLLYFPILTALNFLIDSAFLVVCSGCKLDDEEFLSLSPGFYLFWKTLFDFVSWTVLVLFSHSELPVCPGWGIFNGSKGVLAMEESTASPVRWYFQWIWGAQKSTHHPIPLARGSHGPHLHTYP